MEEQRGLGTLTEHQPWIGTYRTLSLLLLLVQWALWEMASLRR